MNINENIEPNIKLTPIANKSAIEKNKQQAPNMNRTACKSKIGNKDFLNPSDNDWSRVRWLKWYFLTLDIIKIILIAPTTVVINIAIAIGSVKLYPDMKRINSVNGIGANK